MFKRILLLVIVFVFIILAAVFTYKNIDSYSRSRSIDELLISARKKCSGEISPGAYIGAYGNYNKCMASEGFGISEFMD